MVASLSQLSRGLEKREEARIRDKGVPRCRLVNARDAVLRATNESRSYRACQERYRGLLKTYIIGQNWTPLGKTFGVAPRNS